MMFAIYAAPYAADLLLLKYIKYDDDQNNVKIT